MLKILFILSILLPIINSEVFRYQFEDSKFALFDMGSSVITVYYFYYKKELHFTYFGILVLILLFLMILSIFQSVNIGYSFESLFRFFNTVILVIFIYERLKSKQITIEQLNNFVLIASFIFSIYYTYGVYFDIFGSRNAFSPVGHVNYTAHLLDIWIPLLLLNFFIQKNLFLKYFSLFLMLFLVELLLISMIRGSILSLVVSEVGIVLFILLKSKKIVIYPLITFSLIALFLINKAFYPSTIEKHVDKNVEIPSTITKIDTQVLNRVSANRLNIYSNTIDMIIDNPFGVGIGNFEYIHPKYAKVGTIDATNYVNEFEVFSNPHNIILNFSSELGWVGGFLSIVILIIFIIIMVSNILHGDIRDYIIATAFFTNLLHSMLSALFLTPVHLFFVTFIFAMLLYRYFSRAKKRVILTLKLTHLKFLPILMFLWFLTFYISKYYCNQFTVQRNFKYIEYATLFNPFNEYAYLKHARYEAYANKDYSLALFYIDKFLALYPYSINGLIKKATFEYQLKQYRRALNTVDKLLLLDYKNKKALKLKNRISNIN